MPDKSRIEYVVEKTTKDGLVSLANELQTPSFIVWNINEENLHTLIGCLSEIGLFGNKMHFVYEKLVLFSELDLNGDMHLYLTTPTTTDKSLGGLPGSISDGERFYAGFSLDRSGKLLLKMCVGSQSFKPVVEKDVENDHISSRFLRMLLLATGDPNMTQRDVDENGNWHIVGATQLAGVNSPDWTE